MGCLTSKQLPPPDDPPENKLYLVQDNTPFKAADVPAQEVPAKQALLTSKIKEKIYINGRPIELPPNSPLSAEEFSASLVTSYGTQSARMEGAAYQLSYAYVTKQLTAPLTKMKSSKACWAKAQFDDDEEQLCFGVVEGQGRDSQDKREAAAYAKQQIPVNLLQAFADGLAQPQGALASALETTSGQLLRRPSSDHSGAQVITAFVQGRNIHLASIGDCSAVVAQKQGQNWVPSTSQAAPGAAQTPGIDGVDSSAANVSPASSLRTVSKRRLGLPQAPSDPQPGVANGLSEPVSQPDLTMHRMGPNSPTLVLGNQGALAHLTDKQVIDVVCNGEDIQDLQHAALLLVTAAYASWLEQEGGCPADLTVLVLQGSEFVEDMPGIFHEVPAFAKEMGL